MDFFSNDVTHTKISVLSASASILGLCTQTNIGWAVGIIAGIFAIYSSILSIQEKRLSIKEKRVVLKMREIEETKLLISKIEEKEDTHEPE